MTDFPYAIMGFDLDGTLLDTSDELTASVNHTLGLMGRKTLTRDQ
ncbi:MAG: phosphoglycolate phosphatase, partial [Novosphingopyxis baekryungensis]|nr:phosphoglycolate phosphatase [Novosphingopyxis baekryungensis]